MTTRRKTPRVPAVDVPTALELVRMLRELAAERQGDCEHWRKAHQLAELAIINLGENP